MIKEFRPDKRILAERRRVLGRCVKNALETHGDDFAGFALVTWDMRGNAHTSYCAGTGPIGEGLVPSYSQDALNRHVAVALTQRTSTNRIDGGVD